MGDQLGQPNCPYCLGKGHIRSGRIYRICQCRRPNKAQQQAIRRAGEVLRGRRWRMPGSEDPR